MDGLSLWDTIFGLEEYLYVTNPLVSSTWISHQVSCMYPVSSASIKGTQDLTVVLAPTDPSGNSTVEKDPLENLGILLYQSGAYALAGFGDGTLTDISSVFGINVTFKDTYNAPFIGTAHKSIHTINPCHQLTSPTPPL